MLSQSLQKTVNDQIKKEIESAYLYLGMSMFCETQNLKGAARWLKLQWDEELGHAMRFVEHVHARGGTVTLQALAAPPASFASLKELFAKVLEHERSVTASIHAVYAQALKENDYALQVELQWFVKEQVEEEESVMDIVAQLEMIGESATALLMLDRSLGARAQG
jgi:ferritin